MSSGKPATARHLKDATRNNNLSPIVLKQLYEKAMDPKYTTKVDGYDCVFSTRTGSKDMPQLKLEMKEGKKIQILCVLMPLLSTKGRKPCIGLMSCHIFVAFVNV